MDEQPGGKKSRTSQNQTGPNLENPLLGYVPGNAASEELREYLDKAMSEELEPSSRWDYVLWLGTDAPLVAEAYEALRRLAEHAAPLVAKGAKMGLEEFEERVQDEGLNPSELPRQFPDLGESRGDVGPVDNAASGEEAALASRETPEASIREEPTESRIRLGVKGRNRLINKVRRLVEEDPERWEIGSLYDPLEQVDYGTGLVPLGDFAALVDYTKGRDRVAVTGIKLIPGGTVVGERTRAQSNRQPELKEARLPAVEGAADKDAKTPERSQRLLLEAVRRFIEAHPERAKELADQVVRVADEKRPLDKQRLLGIADAIRITGLSESRIKQLARAGQIGEKRGVKRWSFSEFELVGLAGTERPRGRPKKDKAEESSGPR